MMLDLMITLDKFLVKSHGNGSYPSQKLCLVMDWTGLKIIGIQDDIEIQFNIKNKKN